MKMSVPDFVRWFNTYRMTAVCDVKTGLQYLKMSSKTRSEFEVSGRNESVSHSSYETMGATNIPDCASLMKS